MAAPRPPLLTPRFARLLAANFCFFLTFASFFLLPLHVRALGGSERTVGFVMGMSGVAGLASVFVVGPLLDRYGRKRFLRGGIAVMALSSFGFVFVESVGPLLFALRLVQGLAFAAGFNASSTLAVEFAPVARRAAALGVFGVSTLTTHALAPALGELIVEAGSFGWLFVAAGTCSLIGFAIAWPLEPPPRPAPTGAPARPSAVMVASLVTVAGCGLAFGAVLTFVPTFVRDAHLGRVGTFFLAYTGAAILTRLFGGGIGDAFERRMVIVPSIALLSVAIAGLATVTTAVGLALAAVVFGFAQGIAYPTLNAFAADQTEASRLGRTQTLYNGAFNLGVTSGAFVLGPVVAAYGHRTMFRCAAAVAFAACAVFWTATRAPLTAPRPAAD
jgi:MFS family permease